MKLFTKKDYNASDYPFVSHNNVDKVQFAFSSQDAVKEFQNQIGTTCQLLQKLQSYSGQVGDWYTKKHTEKVWQLENVL